jgi:hypothetical protein
VAKHSFIRGLGKYQAVNLNSDDALHFSEQPLDALMRYAHYQELSGVIRSFSVAIRQHRSGFKPVVSVNLALEDYFLIDPEALPLLEEAVMQRQKELLAKQLIGDWEAEINQLRLENEGRQPGKEVERKLKVKVPEVIQAITGESQEEAEQLLAAYLFEKVIPGKVIKDLLAYAWYGGRISNEAYVFLSAYAGAAYAKSWLNKSEVEETGKEMLKSLLNQVIPGGISAFCASSLALGPLLTSGIALTTAVIYPMVVSRFNQAPTYEAFKQAYLQALVESEAGKQKLNAAEANLKAWLEANV